MTKTIIFIIISAFGGLSCVNSNGQRTEQHSKDKYNKGDAENFVKKLEVLGYFKYADKSNLESLKKNLVNSYDPNSELTSIWDNSLGTPKDFRYYYCDGEAVYEEGGITELIKDLKPTFDKLNFTCITSNHIEEWDEKNKWLNHRLTINGTEYVIFKNFKEIGWGEAPMKIAEILNIELEKQKKDERIYLASGGNDGRLIFLTKELYDYIYSVYKNPIWKPLEINEWAKVMQVKPMKLD